MNKRWLKISKAIVTIDEIDNSLYDLDTEYREALAHCLRKHKYLSDSPIKLYYGNEKQKKELKEVYARKLKAEEIKDIINYIKDEMKGDFQYREFKPIAKKYIQIAREMERENEEEFE